MRTILSDDWLPAMRKRHQLRLQFHVVRRLICGADHHQKHVSKWIGTFSRNTLDTRETVCSHFIARPNRVPGGVLNLFSGSFATCLSRMRSCDNAWQPDKFLSNDPYLAATSSSQDASGWFPRPYFGTI